MPTPPQEPRRVTGRRGRPWLVLALALVAALPPAIAVARDGPGPAAAARSPVGSGRTLDAPPAGSAWVAASDEGRPTVLWANARDRAPSADPIAAARWHLARQRSRYGVSPAALDALAVRLVHRTRGGGALVWFDQRLHGLQVYPARVSVLVDGDGALVAIGGQPLEVPLATPPRAALTAASAVAATLADLLEAPFDAALLEDAGLRGDGWRAWALAPGAELAAGLRLREEARAVAIWAPTPRGLVPAYRVEVQASVEGSGEDVAWAYVVGSSDGAVLSRQDLVHDGAFRVWLTDDGRPEAGPEEDFLPHPTGAPQSGFPGYVPPALVTVEAFNVNPSGGSDPWLAPDATTLSGNNVDVYLDLSAPSGFGEGDLRPTTATPGVFDALYDPTVAPDASDEQLRASAQPVFVLSNWLHDWYYDAGFDEAAGNAQASNFGRGGWGGDPVVVEAQDYGFGGAANMLVPGDGASPRLQVGNWPGSPNRPGALDATIVGHEWLHHLHLRLVYCLSQQCIAESEGWSDALAVHMLLDEGDDLDGSYAIATYAARYVSLDSAYFGARRYPYSADLGKNPLTLRHIGQSASLPTTAPRNPYTGGTNNEVHRAGEVWASMVWQAYMELLRDTLGPAPRLSYDEARRRLSEYAVTAMMLAPVDPSYTEQRDTLLAAAREVDADDYSALARGFAARGAGTCAVGAARESTTFDDVVEGFEVAPIPVMSLVAIDDGIASCDADGQLDAGEVGRARIRITNLGAVPLEGASLGVSAEAPEVSLPEGGSFAVEVVPPGGEVVVEVPVGLAADAVGPIDVALAMTLTAPTLCGGELVVRDGALASFEPAPASAYVETGEVGGAGWTAAGSSGVWSLRRLGPGEHAFHGADSGRPTAARLVSPAMAVAAGASLTVTLRHAYRFETDPDGPTYYDGGIIEISSNGGASWQDVATVTASPYPGTIVAGSSPLSQRAAFVGESPGYPALGELTLDLGAGFGGKTVRLGFTLATDAFAGDAGWLIDDIEVAGLAAPPFDGAVASAPPAVFVDGDADGYGVGAGVPLCPVSSGYAAVDGDCDDIDEAAHPGADEVCNGVDDDCDGDTDEDLDGCDEPGPDSAAEPGPEPIAEPGPEPVAEPEPDVIEPDVIEPDVIEPDVAEADVTEPVVAEPDVAEPGVAEPDVAEPDVAEPDVAEPDSDAPDVTDPDVGAPLDTAAADAPTPETRDGAMGLDAATDGASATEDPCDGAPCAPDATAHRDAGGCAGAGGSTPWWCALAWLASAVAAASRWRLRRSR